MLSKSVHSFTRRPRIRTTLERLLGAELVAVGRSHTSLPTEPAPASAERASDAQEVAIAETPAAAPANASASAEAPQTGSADDNSRSGGGVAGPRFTTTTAATKPATAYRAELTRSGTSRAPAFRLDPDVAQRFNAYATAAYPYEIGGLLRVVQDDDGTWVAVDVHIFPQEVSPVYFELDGQAVAQFNMDLFREGRKDEIPQWRSLIHSHPDMTPFMSGPDRENIERLAGEGFAFSVICSAHSQPRENYFAVHYAQGGPLAMMVHSLPFADTDCAGLERLDDTQLKFIEQDVTDLCADHGTVKQELHRPHATGLAAIRDSDEPSTASRTRLRYISQPQANPSDASRRFSPAVISSFDDEIGFDTSLLTDGQYTLLDIVISQIESEDGEQPSERETTLNEILDAANRNEVVVDLDALLDLEALMDEYEWNWSATEENDFEDLKLALGEALAELQAHEDAAMEADLDDPDASDATTPISSSMSAAAPATAAPTDVYPRVDLDTNATPVPDVTTTEELLLQQVCLATALALVETNIDEQVSALTGALQKLQKRQMDTLDNSERDLVVGACEERIAMLVNTSTDDCTAELDRLEDAVTLLRGLNNTVASS